MKKMEVPPGFDLSRDQSVTEKSKAESLQSPLRSPLFWRITAVVFLCIVIIEAILLFFSWLSERDRLLTRIDDSFVLLSPILIGSESYHELDKLISHPGESGRSKSRQHPLLGYILTTNLGHEKSGGDVSDLKQVSQSINKRHFNPDSGFYDSVLSLSSRDESQRMTLWYRVDASHVTEDLRAYVYRILGLVVLISLFVTVGCLLGLTPLLIRPLQKLDKLMVNAQRNGLRQVVAPATFVARQDELGNVYRSFDRLRQALICAEDENIGMTERFQGFADLGADSFWETDHRLRISYAAGDIVGMFGVPASELIGMSPALLEARMVNTIPGFGGIVPALKSKGLWEGKFHLQHTDAAQRTVRIVTQVLRDRQGRFRGVRGAVIDISVASDLAAELQYQATHDSLTGLCNRREFDRILTEEMLKQQDSHQPFCVCMLDLDRFKVVNDNCGHAAGDNLLKQLASMIQSTVREHDLVSRHGGDEFSLMLRDCMLEDGFRIVETIRETFNQFRFCWEGQLFSVGVSIGIAEVVPEMIDAETVLMAADTCCIKAKSLGRNQVQAYRPDDEDVVKQYGEMQWIARITQALEEDYLQLYQQPIEDISRTPSDEFHCEVLLRMQGKDEVVHAPGEFLPAAERFGLLGKIDRWVVTHVVSWLESQAVTPDHRLCININLSGITVSDESFQAFLRETLIASRVSANHLCFEITESTAMGSAGRTIEFLEEIRAIGCRVALDDFGTGFSSLSQIKQLPLDYIKIDGVFIQGLVDNKLDRALVSCVADFASILDVRTVAEFVESEDVVDVLRELNIDYAQGYLFGRPSPLADVSLFSQSKVAD